MQKSSKAATAALLTLLFTACTAESQGSPGAQAAAALNASQLIAAATDPALVSQQVVELAVSAAGPGLAVSSSQELWQALQSADDSSGITSIVLQGERILRVAGTGAGGARPRPCLASAASTPSCCLSLLLLSLPSLRRQCCFGSGELDQGAHPGGPRSGDPLALAPRQGRWEARWHQQAGRADRAACLCSSSRLRRHREACRASPRLPQRFNNAGDLSVVLRQLHERTCRASSMYAAPPELAPHPSASPAIRLERDQQP